MEIDPTTLYRQIGRLLETAPKVNPHTATQSDDLLQWMGRADALITQIGDVSMTAAWRTAVTNLSNYPVYAVGEMRRVLYQALGQAELYAPPSERGAFIPAGDGFDAFAAVSKVLQSASRDILIVDPYMDEAVLTEFGHAFPDGISACLLSDEATHKPSLIVATQKWHEQYGSQRPLEVRLAGPRHLHDRAIFIDQATGWTLTQSLKDFAKRAPAEIVRADDIAHLKIQAYEDLWSGAKNAL